MTRPAPYNPPDPDSQPPYPHEPYNSARATTSSTASSRARDGLTRRFLHA